MLGQCRGCSSQEGWISVQLRNADLGFLKKRDSTRAQTKNGITETGIPLLVVEKLISPKVHQEHRCCDGVNESLEELGKIKKILYSLQWIHTNIPLASLLTWIASTSAFGTIPTRSIGLEGSSLRLLTFWASASPSLVTGPRVHFPIATFQILSFAFKLVPLSKFEVSVEVDNCSLSSLRTRYPFSIRSSKLAGLISCVRTSLVRIILLESSRYPMNISGTARRWDCMCHRGQGALIYLVGLARQKVRPYIPLAFGTFTLEFDTTAEKVRGIGSVVSITCRIWFLVKKWVQPLLDRKKK